MANSDTPNRRNSDTIHVDKAMRITTTVGSLIAVIVGVWFIGRYTDQLEGEGEAIRAEMAAGNAELVAEIHLMRDEIERTLRIQDAYIEARNDEHDVMDREREEAHHAMARFREEWALRFDEILP